MRDPYSNNVELQVEEKNDGINERKLSKVMQKYKPLTVSGQESIDNNRIVLWKQYAYFGSDPDTKFLIEISKNKHRFFIVAMNMTNNAYHTL